MADSEPTLNTTSRSVNSLYVRLYEWKLFIHLLLKHFLFAPEMAWRAPGLICLPAPL